MQSGGMSYRFALGVKAEDWDIHEIYKPVTIWRGLSHELHNP